MANCPPGVVLRPPNAQLRPRPALPFWEAVGCGGSVLIIRDVTVSVTVTAVLEGE